MLATPASLAILAKLLLCNEVCGNVWHVLSVSFQSRVISPDNKVRLVETAASLLRHLVEGNQSANSKLYLTGAFFFICKYPGNNFLPLAKLLEATHLHQSFHDSAAHMARLVVVGSSSGGGSSSSTYP